MASHDNMMMFAQAAMKASNSFYNSNEEQANFPNLGKRLSLINGSSKLLPMQAAYSGGIGNVAQGQIPQQYSSHLQNQQ